MAIYEKDFSTVSLDSPVVSRERKEAIQGVYQSLNITQLKREIERLQQILEKSVVAKRPMREEKKEVVVPVDHDKTGANDDKPGGKKRKRFQVDFPNEATIPVQVDF